MQPSPVSFLQLVGERQVKSLATRLASFLWFLAALVAFRYSESAYLKATKTTRMTLQYDNANKNCSRMFSSCMHLKLILSNNPKTVSAFVMRSLHPDNNRLKAKEYGLMRNIEQAAVVAFNQKNEEALNGLLGRCGTNRTLLSKIESMKAQLYQKK